VIEAIRESANRRRITRICHFTPSRNLVHIATDPRGVLATAHLKDSDRTVFNATDLERMDGHADHVCCSIQYPNAWYFRRARGAERLFQDWVVLLINPRHLWADGTKFCARNAAAGYGSGVSEGPEAFEAMFVPRVSGAYGNTYVRSQTHPTWLPTDEQAEVLIPDRVAREDILAIAVADESQAKREHARLTQLLVQVPPIVIAADFFNPRALSSQLRSGRVPLEIPFDPGVIR